MRRQSFYVLLLALFLLFLPIVSDNGIRLGIFDYAGDISGFLRLILDPQYVAEPIQIKVLASLYSLQLLGWICFAVALLIVALLGLIRGKSPLKSAMILSIVVLVHGILEVILSVTLASAPLINALFTRFGIDLSDFMDDYDALLNSTLVPIGLIVWFILDKRSEAKLQRNPETSVIPTENS